ncbi:iron ABC transporter permease [Geomicrobium sp. JCM 19039]|uniref:FecCD family ABC transporter permease n=1 Tax=Geomicrobium sp. JCM 19039 TaxID=1460636 RepID=UPI00045F2C59|nr:iron ABC transporter permease [Geomicrobium sp. JCM 19039]GAK13983.1 ferrichrome transport system permease protein FhuB [Geomicrobium sp. JCM 19039]
MTYEVLKSNRWRWSLTISLPVLLIGAMAASMAFGAVFIGPQSMYDIIRGDGDMTLHAVAWNVRMPRIILAALVGAALAASGAILQGVMRNPLADAGIIGVTAGGGLAATIAMVALPQFAFLLPPFAFLGALLTSLTIYGLAWSGGASPLKIILSGVAINALLGAMQSGIMIIFSDRVQSVLPWLAGGLQGRGWHHVEFVLPYLVVGLGLTFFSARSLNILTLGEQSAIALGTRLERSRLVLIVLASLLAGAAVSVSGLIAFVGLLVPHAIRLLCGPDYRYLLPLSMLGGALLVVVADTMVRTLFDPLELPVGILLAVIGAPWFLWIVRKYIPGRS